MHERLFVGCLPEENGNDYPVNFLSVECVAAAGWQNTTAFLETLIPQLAAASV